MEERASRIEWYLKTKKGYGATMTKRQILKEMNTTYAGGYKTLMEYIRDGKLESFSTKDVAKFLVENF